MRQRTFASPILLSMVFSAFACDQVETPVPNTTARDSVGIRIVENRMEPDPRITEWIIEAEPDWVIGSPSGEAGNDLLYVQGVFQLSDGRVALGNSGTGELRIYTSQGEFQVAFGGFGEGPGEFSDIELAGVLPGDTIVAIDDDLRRISLFHPDAGFVRSASVDRRDGGHLYSEGIVGNRSLLTYSGFSFSNIPAEDLVDGYYRAPVTYSLHSLDGSFINELGPYPGPEYNLRVIPSETGVGVRSTGIPFGKFPLCATSGDRVFLSFGDSPEIREFSSTGTLRGILRDIRDPISVTGELRASLLETRIAGIESEAEIARARAQFREQPFPAFLPSFGELISDPLGFLWAQEFPHDPASVTTFRVFDPTGALTAQVKVPPRFQVREIGSEYLLGVVRDEYDVEYLHRLVLRRQ